MDGGLEDNLPWNKVQEQLTCSICLEYFVKPRTLGCLHTFCETCLAKCLKKAINTDGIITTTAICPVCRKPADMDENGVEGECCRALVVSITCTRTKGWL